MFLILICPQLLILGGSFYSFGLQPSLPPNGAVTECDDLTLFLLNSLLLLSSLTPLSLSHSLCRSEAGVTFSTVLQSASQKSVYIVSEWSILDLLTD